VDVTRAKDAATVLNETAGRARNSYSGQYRPPWKAHHGPRDANLRGKFKRQAWFIFAGFALSVLAALLSLFGKWFHCETLVLAAVVVFIAAALWVVAAAVAMVREIK
jgi:hypothetical protein